MNKTIYLAHYDLAGGPRDISPAGVTVMDYLIDCFRQKNGCTTVISSARVKQDYTKRQEIDLDNVKIIFPDYPGRAKKWDIAGRYIGKILYRKKLYRELCDNLNDGDTLVIYHSLMYIDIIKKLLKKRKVTLVLQVCEIYGDVLSRQDIKNEELDFFKLADKYIFQSQMLADYVNTDKKPYLVLHGTYKAEHLLSEKRNDGKVHCVYAGTLDPRKGGAIAAAAALNLPSDYHIHILGFGTPMQIAEMRTIIDDVQKRACCTVSYDGCLAGDEYKQFIQGCEIGLSTQNPSEAFNSTSFPSKILAYMANGLKVVTIRIPAIEGSPMGHALFYYDEQAPEKIAEAIVRASKEDCGDSRDVIKELNDSFLSGFKSFI